MDTCHLEFLVPKEKHAERVIFIYIYIYIYLDTPHFPYIYRRFRPEYYDFYLKKTSMRITTE